VETVRRAAELGRFYLAHARAAFAEMGADPEVENAKHLFAWISRKRVRTFSERDALQGTKGRFKKMVDLRPALELLEDHRYIRELPRQKKSGRGRPKGPIYEVNPRVEWNSEDIENIGKGTQKTVSTSISSSEEDKPISELPFQNLHNPQKDSDGELADDRDEVVL
jgi:hypothetical protein